MGILDLVEDIGTPEPIYMVLCSGDGSIKQPYFEIMDDGEKQYVFSKEDAATIAQELKEQYLEDEFVFKVVKVICYDPCAADEIEVKDNLVAEWVVSKI